jgi:hypothetical protein
MINYVIASYSGIIKLRKGDETSPYVLQYNLSALFDILLKKKKYGIENLISQVTIVCPKPRTEPYPNFYRKDYWVEQFATHLPNVAIVFMDYVGENKHASYDQWIQAYLKYPDFDYYMLIEDDYCIHPTCVSFDAELVDMYKENFSNDIGYLCSMAGNMGCPTYHAAISNGLISGKSFKSLGPDILTKYYNVGIQTNNACQISFSLLFTASGIPLADMVNVYQAPFYESSESKKIMFNPKNVARIMFTPIQFVSDDVTVRDKI